jgi:hypothetical protein
MSLSDRYALTELERATGLVIGPDADGPKLPPAPRGVTPREALADSIRSALQRPPCMVLFSGGRDSSALLATAADLAQKERMPAPVALTYRFPGEMARAGESPWQELVVAHARVEDWIRIEVTDELDCLGPIGLDVLRRHGLIFPTAPHNLIPALRLCGGGSLLTGIGGDEILGRRSHVADVLAGRVRPVPRDVARIAIAIGPRGVRRARARRQAPNFVNWLTPAGRAAFESQWGEVVADNPLAWGTGIRWTWRSRSHQIAFASMDVLAGEHDVQLRHPFVSPRFVSVYARAGGIRGYAGRTEVMRMLFAGILPDEINTRPTKAVFGQPHWTHYSQDFARSWNGEGVNPDLVDVDVLRRLWGDTEPPPGPTLILLKQAWMASSGIAQRFETASRRRPAALGN